MKEYVIYSRVRDIDGCTKPFYAAYNDDYGAKFIRKKDEGYCKILRFPTLNSAIIWWRGHIEWIGLARGFYSSILDYDEHPIINIGEVTDGNLRKLVTVHRLEMGASPLNEPDKNTWTLEERKDYEWYLERETLVRNALAYITSNMHNNDSNKTK